jgi:hypothetical protein
MNIILYVGEKLSENEFPAGGKQSETKRFSGDIKTNEKVIEKIKG